MERKTLLARTLFTLAKIALFTMFALSYKVNAANIHIDSRGFLEINGDIKFSDAATIANMAESKFKFPNVMLLRSNGGVVASAMFIGSLVSEANWKVIAVEYCNSACPLILFASRDSMVYNGTKVGVHAPSRIKDGKRVYTTLYDKSYWKSYGLLRASGMENKKVLELLEIIYTQHTKHMRYFTEEELEYFDVKILRD